MNQAGAKNSDRYHRLCNNSNFDVSVHFGYAYVDIFYYSINKLMYAKTLPMQSAFTTVYPSYLTDLVSQDRNVPGPP